MVAKALGRITRLVKRKKKERQISSKKKKKGDNSRAKYESIENDAALCNTLITPATADINVAVPTSISYETANITNEESYEADLTEESSPKLRLPSHRRHDSSNSAVAVCLDEPGQDYDDQIPSLPTTATTATSSFESVEEIAKLTPSQRQAFDEFITSPSDEQWKKLVRSLQREIQRDRRRRRREKRDQQQRYGNERQRSDSFREQQSSPSPPISVVGDLSMSQASSSHAKATPDSYVGEVMDIEKMEPRNDKMPALVCCSNHRLVDHKVAVSQQDENDTTQQARVAALPSKNIVAQQHAIVHIEEMANGTRRVPIASNSRAIYNGSQDNDHGNRNTVLVPLAVIPVRKDKGEVPPSKQESTIPTAVIMPPTSSATKTPWYKQKYILIPTALYLIRTPTVLILCALVSIGVILGMLSEVQRTSISATSDGSDADRSKEGASDIMANNKSNETKTTTWQFRVVSNSRSSLSSSSIPSPTETDCTYY